MKQGLQNNLQNKKVANPTSLGQIIGKDKRKIKSPNYKDRKSPGLPPGTARFSHTQKRKQRIVSQIDDPKDSLGIQMPAETKISIKKPMMDRSLVMTSMEQRNQKSAQKLKSTERKYEKSISRMNDLSQKRSKSISENVNYTKRKLKKVSQTPLPEEK